MLKALQRQAQKDSGFLAGFKWAEKTDESHKLTKHAGFNCFLVCVFPYDVSMVIGDPMSMSETKIVYTTSLYSYI